MNSEAEFVAAIAASPDDGLLLRAFADWLEERGDRRAAWVRSGNLREWMGPAFEDPVPKMIAALKKRRRVMAVRHAAGEVGAAMVPELIELLKHEHPYVREQAIWCLRRIGKAASEAIPALMEALKDGDDGVRAQAGNAIKQIGARKGDDTKALHEALSRSDSSDRVREKAASILGSLGATNAAFDGLVARLADADAATRQGAVEGLGSLGTPDVIAPLCRALADADPGVRLRAVERLARLVNPATGEAVEPLRAALRDSELDVRHHAITALGAMKQTAVAAVDNLVTILQCAEMRLACVAAQSLAEIAAGDGEVLTALHEATRHADVTVAIAAATAMNHWPRLPPESADAVMALFARLHGRHQWEGGWVLASLGRLERPTPAVMALLREQIRNQGRGVGGAVRALLTMGAAGAEAIPELAAAVGRDWHFDAPAKALARMGEAGIRRLVELLGSENEQARNHALAALCEAGEAAAPALPRLRALLREGGADYWRHRLTLSALRAIGPRAAEAIPEVIPLLATETYGENDEVTLMLSSFGPALVPHLPQLVAEMRDLSRSRAHARVAVLLRGLIPHGAEVLAPLQQALRVAAFEPNEQDWGRVWNRRRTRLAAAEGLGDIGAAAAPAVPHLLPLLSDPYEDVRRAAAEALGVIRSPLAVDGLRAALRDADEKVRVKTAEALGLIGEASAAGELALALRDASPRVRREAATALGKVRAKDEGSLAALRQAGRDGDAAVRREAAAALKRIEGKARKAGK